LESAKHTEQDKLQLAVMSTLASDVLVLDKARVYKFERADKIDIGELHKVAGGVRC